MRRNAPLYERRVFVSHPRARRLFAPMQDLAQQDSSASRGKGKFYTLYGATHTAGAMTAWAWGASRILDVIEQSGAAIIDIKRIAVTGCSRNGALQGNGSDFVNNGTDPERKCAFPSESFRTVCAAGP